MASNSEFQRVGNQGWRQGFANLFRKENRLWWRTSRWWVQILIWLVLVNGILTMVIAVAPKMQQQAGPRSEAQSAQTVEQSGEPQQPLDVLGLTVFLRMAGIASAIGVVVLSQGFVFDERQSGTATWVLSKPVSRTAFILSKIISGSIGILMTMVVAQGCIAYLIIFAVTGYAFPVLPFALGMGMLFLSLLFWLTLTIMLSALSNSRGLVIGVPLLLITGFQIFIMIAPWIADYMPWSLTTAVSATKPALGLLLALGQPVPTLSPFIATMVWCLLFTVVGIMRFQKEEF